MKLLIEEDWRFFKKGEFDLDNFSIITGLNGSGKTQLLSSINIGPPSTIKLLNENGSLLANPVFIPVNSISANLGMDYTNSIALRNNSIVNSIDDLWNESWQSYQDSIKNLTKYNYQGTIYDINTIKKYFGTPLIKLAEKLNKDIHSLTEDDLKNYYNPFISYKINERVFDYNLAYNIDIYKKLVEKNELNEYLNTWKKKTDIHYYTPDEFIVRYGESPEIEFNKLLLDFKLNYAVNISEEIKYGVVIPFTNLENGNEVYAHDLSSGEKIILGLAIAFYNSNGRTNLPNVLLLDEPDATLHPALIQTLLNTIVDVFVKKGVKVILTTHAPSTIALAPEEAQIYISTNSPYNLIKVTRDEAISQLTVGVPTLSVRVENRRIVFVESKYDVENLEKLFELLKASFRTEFSLSFFPSDITGDGSCEKVMDLLSKLDEVSNVYGIIDYDNKNVSKGDLKILGEGKRDGIENYIFDPIVLAAYLVQDLQLTKQQVGLTPSDNYLSIVNMENEKLQNLSDKFIEILFEFSPEILASKQFIKSRYLNGCEINIPLWFAETDDHYIEGFVINRFPKLKSLNNRNKLCQDIIGKIFNEMPGLISTDIFETMQSILNK